MTIRAIIFDVYGTLLRVGPPSADADGQWESLFREFLGSAPCLGRLDFSVACNQVISCQHNLARARGIPYPEIQWPEIVAAVLPGFTSLSPSEQEEFVFRQMQIGRTIALRVGVAESLTAFRDTGRLLGIASNSQAYTLRELHEALASVGLDLTIFERAVNFWSFENGFSKPDPHVFQVLTARLGARGIPTSESLMVGDRLDNDVATARAYGWQTWQLTESPADGMQAGDWEQLQQRYSGLDSC